MSSRETGHRFRLLIYRQMVGRYRGAAFALAVLLLGLWYLVSREMLAWPRPPADAWLLSGGLVSLALGLFTLLSPSLAYVQPRADHLRLQTPFYRLRVSYRRVQGTRPIDFAKMFPPSSLHPGQRHLAQHFYGRTALGVDLRDLPLSRFVLRLFFSRFLFAADQSGLVLLVHDWMGLSRQLSNLLDAWRDANQPRQRGPGTGVAAILDEE